MSSKKLNLDALKKKTETLEENNDIEINTTDETEVVSENHLTSNPEDELNIDFINEKLEDPDIQAINKDLASNSILQEKSKILAKQEETEVEDILVENKPEEVLEIEQETEKKKGISLGSLTDKVEKNIQPKVEEVKVEKKVEEKKELFGNYKSDFNDIEFNPKEYLKGENDKKQKGWKKIYLWIFIIILLACVAWWVFVYKDKLSWIIWKTKKVDTQEQTSSWTTTTEKQEKKEDIKEQIVKEVWWNEYQVEKITNSDWKVSFIFNEKTYNDEESLQKELEKISKASQKETIRDKTKKKVIERYKD